MTRGDRISLAIGALAIGVPFLLIVALGSGQPHSLHDRSTDAVLAWLAIVALAAFARLLYVYDVEGRRVDVCATHGHNRDYRGECIRNSTH